MRSSLLRMRSSLVVRASDCQCTSCNGPGFDPSIRRHSGIWGAADEAVLNIVWKKSWKIPQKNNRAMYAAFRAEQLKVAIPRWLCLHQKEGLLQEEENLTAMSKSAYLFSASCEKWISCLSSGAFIYKQGEGAIWSKSASLHSTGNISAEDSKHQEQSRPQQHTWNSKLYVVFPLKSTATHSLHIQHL